MTIRRGQRFTMNGERWRVAYVNPTRAHCVSEQKRVVTVQDRRTGSRRTFTATAHRAIDISPNTPLELLQ